MVSALSGDGVADLRHTLAAMVPPGRFTIRGPDVGRADGGILALKSPGEKIFRQLHQENCPYQSTVETDSWTERKDKSIRIDRRSLVEREASARSSGKGGATIKSIGADSRKEIGRDRGRPRAPFLVREGAAKTGADDPNRYREMGLESEGIAGALDGNVPKNVVWFCKCVLYMY